MRLLLLGLLTGLTSLIAIAAEPAPVGKPIVMGHSYSIESKILGQKRHLTLYLPPEYADSKETFPLMVLLDGGVKEDFHHIVGIASLAAEYRKIRPFIVVGIENIDRYHDLLHPSKVAEDKKFKPTAGGAADFRRFIAEELMPFVKKNWRVNEETVLMGESAAGLFVVETLLKTPDLFQAYVAISPSLWWEEQSLAKSAVAALKQRPFPAKRRLFISIADEGGTMQGGVDLVVNALKEQAPEDFRWTYQPMHEEGHGTIYHPAALAAVRFIFATPAKKH